MNIYFKVFLFPAYSATKLALRVFKPVGAIVLLVAIGSVRMLWFKFETHINSFIDFVSTLI
jgi:hypothetical protein